MSDQIEERFGVELDPEAIARVELGKRRVSVNEMCLFAAALGVPPVLLVIPVGESEPVEVAPGVELLPWDAFQWLSGGGPADARLSAQWFEATRPILRYSELLWAVMDAEDARMKVDFGADDSEGYDLESLRDRYAKALAALKEVLAELEAVGLATGGFVPDGLMSDVDEAPQPGLLRDRLREANGGVVYRFSADADTGEWAVKRAHK